jgi:MFS family permease
VPLGAVAFVIIAIFFKSPQRTKEASIGFSERLKQFDIVGTIVFVPAIVCLLLALQWGGTEYPWSDGRIIALFVVFALLIIVFVAVQFRNDERVTVPIRIASQRSVAASALFGMLLSGSFFLFIFYLPIWFQAIKGTTATESGIHNLPLILAQVFASIASGVAISKIGYYTPFMYASTVFAALGSGLITTFAVDTPTSRWIGYQIIYGLGSGMGFQQPMMAAQTVLPLDDVPIGTAFVMFIQLLGGAMFVSVGENIFTNQLVRNVVATVPTLDPQVVLQTGATALRGIVDADRLPALLAAYNDALTKTYQVALILASLSAVFAALMEWRSVKGKQVEKDG